MTSTFFSPLAGSSIVLTTNCSQPPRIADTSNCPSATNRSIKALCPTVPTTTAYFEETFFEETGTFLLVTRFISSARRQAVFSTTP